MISEHTHSINGVPGRMHNIHDPQIVRGNLVYLNQTWISVSRPVDREYYGQGCTMQVKIRFDDNCKNGHQTFNITADIRNKRDMVACGCLHDEIAKYFPELIPLIKWHLFSTDGPLHYIANTVYHAGNRDCYGRTAGMPSAWETVIYFGTSPVSHKINDKFAKFLESRRGTGDFQIIAFNHPDKPETYSANYTFAGFGESWAGCPFRDRTTAEQWQTACNSGDFRIDRIVTDYSKGKDRDLDAARNTAVWPEATDEQLSVEPEELKAALLARLPGLIADFRQTMEQAGFLWEPGADNV